MRGNVISYIEMCQREGTSLQRGMNFRLKGRHSVILMSIRPGAPYQDKIQEGGSVLIYEGHDVPKRKGVSDPKQFDQPEYQPNGSLTENGKFHRAAQLFKKVEKGPDIVQVYEKIKAGIWTDNGFSIWSILGLRTMGCEMFLSLSSSLSKGFRTSRWLKKRNRERFSEVALSRQT